MNAVARFQKLLGVINRAEGYDPRAQKLPLVVPYCKVHHAALRAGDVQAPALPGVCARYRLGSNQGDGR